MILHFDADAFFASVEQASDKKLRGRPVAVGGERRGIIASAALRKPGGAVSAAAKAEVDYLLERLARHDPRAGKPIA